MKFRFRFAKWLSKLSLSRFTDLPVLLLHVAAAVADVLQPLLAATAAKAAAVVVAASKSSP